MSTDFYTNPSPDVFLLPGTGEWIFKILATLGALLIAIIWATPAQKEYIHVRKK